VATLNILSNSSDWRARKLSNFSSDSFIIDGETMASVEGFIQGIKFPESDSRRQAAFQSSGIDAKRFGKKAERKFAWWRERAIVYGSKEHHQLIERAIRAKFSQNLDARRALIATEDLALTHDTGKPEPVNSSLPANVFCDILTRIRQELLQARK